LPHQPLHHRVHFLRSPKPIKYELHIGLRLKSIISRVANSVVGWALRPIETRPEEPRAGVRFWEGGSEPPPHQLGILGERCKLPQRGPEQSSGKFGFWSILGPQKSRQNGQLAFELGGTSESVGGACPSPAPTQNRPWACLKLFSDQFFSRF